jgi:hypothetical protein
MKLFNFNKNKNKTPEKTQFQNTASIKLNITVPSALMALKVNYHLIVGQN